MYDAGMANALTDFLYPVQLNWAACSNAISVSLAHLFCIFSWSAWFRSLLWQPAARLSRLSWTSARPFPFSYTNAATPQFLLPNSFHPLFPSFLIIPHNNLTNSHLWRLGRTSAAPSPFSYINAATPQHRRLSIPTISIRSFPHPSTTTQLTLVYPTSQILPPFPLAKAPKNPQNEAKIHPKHYTFKNTPSPPERRSLPLQKLTRKITSIPNVQKNRLITGRAGSRSRLTAKTTVCPTCGNQPGVKPGSGKGRHVQLRHS